ncbi:MAG: hypothetical protein C0391_02585 [Anaerolinea sp.]|nr:hypothetical protein [Anaerolinea sp.]
MNRDKQPYQVILLVLICIFVQLACGLSPETAASDFGAIDCAAKGGVWRQETNQYGELEEWCERNVAPTATIAEPDTTAECLAARTVYHWSYEDFNSSKGTGGVACNARMVFSNRGSETLLLVLYESWDNNAMKSEGWKKYSLPPGGIHEKRVNRTIYTDGVMTFDRVDKMLVLRDLPGCVPDIPSLSLASEWADAAEYIDEMPCP